MPDTHGHVMTFMKVNRILHKAEIAELQKLVLKESAENADLQKPVLNKIMTIHE